MPELVATLDATRSVEERKNKFSAAIQGIDLGSGSEDGKGQKEWEDMKSRVFTGGAVKDSRDITSLQGQNAKKVGFGINNGLEYSSGKSPKNPMS
jgi:translation initiation factor 1 (eIF-1/SUI1)